jgi:hypothetical protein
MRRLHIHHVGGGGHIQHFSRQVKLHTDALNEDVQFTNDRIGQLESAQILTNTKLTTLEQIAGAINTTLAVIIERFERMEQTRHKERK